ncbi:MULTISPECIES: hypothetical protein [unclassified Dyella]|jgi:hypothetical protein|uniref:hypothetical protein n=1 Tax=unclassified Dyella TaxID=2634549 RepID=UPI003F8E47EA
MIKELRLRWEPENTTPLKDIEDRMVSYKKGRDGIIILGNGTLLSLTTGEDDVADARHALDEARFIVDFRVVPLKEGGYMVAFHGAVAVFVGQEEFEQRRSEIEARQFELRFPGESFIVPPDMPAEHVLIGLYARGKLQRDAYNFHFYKKV